MNISYRGMDIDHRCIDWCRTHITPVNPRFTFFCVDLASTTYNPHGRQKTENYTFPFADRSFDLIILTSVFTHLLERGARQIIKEVNRLLTDDGTAYASFFIYRNRAEAVERVERRPFVFPYYRGRYALQDEKFPEAAIAYQEGYVRALFAENHLVVDGKPRYGIQDLFLLKRQNRAEPRHRYMKRVPGR